MCIYRDVVVPSFATLLTKELGDRITIRCRGLVLKLGCHIDKNGFAKPYCPFVLTGFNSKKL